MSMAGVSSLPISVCRYFGAAKELPGVRELFQQAGEQSCLPSSGFNNFLGGFYRFKPDVWCFCGSGFLCVLAGNILCHDVYHLHCN